MEMLNNWWKYIIDSRKAFLIGVAALSVWTLLIWATSQSYGEQIEYYFDWYDLFEWTVLFLVVLSSNFVFQEVIGEKKFISTPWFIALSSFFGCVAAGAIIGFFFKVIAPFLGVLYDVKLTYYDITLPSSATHIVSFAFMGVFVSLFFAQTQVLRYKNHLERRLAFVESENLRQLNKLANLSALQASVNPHFLYNSLNSIAALIRTKSPKSEDMVIALSQLFRYHILPDQAAFATLKQEVEILKTYLDIEKIRFGNQLKYSIEISETLNDVQVPRLLLQPIIENAIKHGTSKVEEGVVRIIGKQIGDKIQIEVYDNGPGFNRTSNTGNGVNTVSKMLQLHYLGDYELEFISEPEKKVLLSIPYKA